MARPKKDLQALARTYTDSAVKTLVGIMQQPNAPEASRVKAAEVLLNRGWGMAKQQVDANLTVNAWHDILAAAQTQIVRHDESDEHASNGIH